MITESRTEAATVFCRSRLKTMTQDIKKLFFDMGPAETDPEERIVDAIAKITEAYGYLEALHKHYPQTAHPGERFRKVRELMERLSASCEKAEGRMESFEERRLARIKHS
ncbi:MAG TPA: hypothetical protein VMA75_01245 [Candidatus Paceibacterota bacterium]|nr:hypothetical protein [Candidatus Paceibacterota bacterium]